MARRKSVCVKWTLVLILVLFSSYVCSRPQESPPGPTTVATIQQNVVTEKSTENLIRITSSSEKSEKNEETLPPESSLTTSRDVKRKTPIIGESIKMVASQLLEKPSNKSSDTQVIADTRIPPKVKTQLAQKHKIKTRNEDGAEPLENAHAGFAVPVSMEELESENSNESSTSNEGISTWILLSNPPNKESSTEPTKVEEKKNKPNKNKNKRPQGKLPISKRPIIGSTNKSDLVAGGSAINENVYNKIKDTVLTNVQKNKNSVRTTTSTSTTSAPLTEIITNKKELVTTKVTPSVLPTKAMPKPSKKSNKKKEKLTTTVVPIMNESAMLPMEPKEQEIELEISTPATTTKKPKRSSTRKKTKTKKRKTTKPKPESTTAVTTELKSSNKTKSTKLHKKPSSLTGPFTTQIYNYFSREVMPSVGVGVIGLAGLLGIAGYFLYPFTATPVRRTFEVDKKDDIYKHNAEEYASEGNGQPEEEMLGTVLAGMPAHTKQKYNPYAAQTTHVNRYTVKKDQDIRYRQVTNSYEPKYNVHYQQKSGIAHGAAYAEPINYNHHKYETRHLYTTQKPSSFAPAYPAVEPIYAAPQTGPSSFGSDTPSSVVYGVKPSHDTDFKPVYPFDAQYHSESTNNPIAYPSTSMYLGSNNEAVDSDNEKYDEDTNAEEGMVDNKFVVGNVPKELTENATPAVVPEHGPRKLKKRRNVRRKRSVVGSIEDILKAAKQNKENEIFISNEIDGGFDTSDKLGSYTGMNDNRNVYSIYAVEADNKDSSNPEILDKQNEIIESVSTLPLNNKDEKTDMSNEIEETTKAFKVYEVFNDGTERSSPLVENEKTETTTHLRNMNTETTTEAKSETTSTMPPSPSVFTETTSISPKPTDGPEIITYPPISSGGYGIFDFIRRLVEFKYRLGLSILQTTSDSLNRYLRSLENSGQKSLKAQ